MLGVIALTSMFYLVPNTNVRLRDAVAGGLIASVAFELGKRGFTAYLAKVPTYKALYGAFAALPMFLLWVYFSWLVTLVAAMMTANMAGIRDLRAPQIVHDRAETASTISLKCRPRWAEIRSWRPPPELRRVSYAFSLSPRKPVYRSSDWAPMSVSRRACGA